MFADVRKRGRPL